jgi:hypothetical protein
MSSITDEQRQQLGWIIEAASRNGLALLEVNEVGTGNPAVLLVAVDKDEEGKGGRMAPLARIDIDFVNGFTPPEGVEQVTSDDEPEVSERSQQCGAVWGNDDVDSPGVGC